MKQLSLYLKNKSNMPNRMVGSVPIIIKLQGMFNVLLYHSDCRGVISVFNDH